MSQVFINSSQNEFIETISNNIDQTPDDDDDDDDPHWTDLHIAAMDGNDKELKKNLLQWKNCVDQQDKYGSTALHFAARWGHTKFLDMLLSEGQANVNVINKIGWSPLHCATWEGELDNVKRLIQTENIKVDCQSQLGWTPLHFAARWGYNDIAAELINTANVRTDVKDNDGHTAAHHAALMGRTGFLKLLNNKGLLNLYEKTSSGKTTIDFAFYNRKTLEFCVDLEDKYGLSFLQHVAIQDHKELFKLLLQKPQKYKGLFPKDDFNSLHTIKGRNEELNQLKHDLEKEKLVIVSGISGIGKTALVKSYAWSNHEYYKNLFWIDCQNEEIFKMCFFKIARFLKIPTKKYDTERDFQTITKDIFNRFKLETGLLVFDNTCDIQEIISKYVIDNLKIDIIIISCQNNLGHHTHLELGPISLESATEIFEPLFEDALLKETDRESIITLASVLKGVPLAIRIAEMRIIHHLFSFPTTESNTILSSYIDQINVESSYPGTKYVDLAENEYEEIVYSVVGMNLNELDSMFSILLIACSFLNPSLISVRCVLKILHLIEVLHSAQRYVRCLIWTINNNKVHFNTYAKKLILHQAKSKPEWVRRGYRNVIELILNENYSKHHKSVLSFAHDYKEIIQKFGKTELLQYLVAHGCVDSLGSIFNELTQEETDKYVKKYNLLFAAVTSGNLRTVRFVYEFDNNVKKLNEKGHTMIWEAIEKNFIEVCDFLISKGASLERIDKLNKTPLHRAAFLGRTDIVKLLLDREVDPNIRNKFRRTPLHYAAMEGHTDVIKELLQHKFINIDARDHYRRSPVFETVRCFQLDALRLFIQKGAKIKTKDNLDLSPVRLAKLQRNKKELLQVFKENGFYE